MTLDPSASAGEYCDEECNCRGCKNTVTHERERTQAIDSILDRNPTAFARADAAQNGKQSVLLGCHCKKSFCLKKYCECFQAGVQCTAACKCISCHNCAEGVRVAAAAAVSLAASQVQAMLSPRVDRPGPGPLSAAHAGAAAPATHASTAAQPAHAWSAALTHMVGADSPWHRVWQQADAILRHAHVGVCFHVGCAVTTGGV